MKKIVVISDSHGHHEVIDEIKKREKDASYYIHCGDFEGDDELLDGWIGVKGNNDWISSYPDERIFEVDGVRFLVAHGHRFGYYDRNAHMLAALKKNNCHVLLFGHSHVPEDTVVDGYHLINPGSTTLPRRGSKKGYCVILVANKNIEIEFKEL